MNVTTKLTPTLTQVDAVGSTRHVSSRDLVLSRKRPDLRMRDAVRRMANAKQKHSAPRTSYQR
jgi:hypothetical protein